MVGQAFRIAAGTMAVVVAVGFALVRPAPALGATTFVVNKIGDAADLNLANSKCDSSSNSGNQCTLRAAIQEANDTAGADTINFNITSASKVITPATPLPPITGTVTINGFSQSGAAANTAALGNNAVLKIVLDGVGAGADADGLDIQSSNSVVRGLVIQRFDGSGILVSGDENNINGNFIGTDTAGTAARGNGSGVTIEGAANLVGGTSPGARNLISGNEIQGILIDGAPAAGNAVQGNYIGTTKNGAAALANSVGVGVAEGSNTSIGGTAAGAGNLISGNKSGIFSPVHGAGNKGTIQGNLIGTDATGSLDLGNQNYGIWIFGGRWTIGGTTAAARNTVSGNGIDGIYISGFASHGNVIQGNYIGTNAAGTSAVGNAGDGLDISNSKDNVVGGTTAGARNLLSGNAAAGLVVVGTQASGNVAQGNLIGTKFDGTGDLGNASAGLKLGGPNNVIGGTSSAAANVISGNGAEGMLLYAFATGNTVQGNVVRLNDLTGIAVTTGPNTIGGGNLILQNGGDGIQVGAATRVRITANQISGNGRLGINLVGGTENALGVTANETDDPDTGANNLQNYPVLNSATRSANGVTTVSGSLNSNPSTQFRIELFLVLAPDSSNHGEGQVLLAAQNVTTNSGGDKNFTLVAGGLTAGQVLTVTATSVTAGNTSEFSANRTVTPVQ